MYHMGKLLHMSGLFDGVHGAAFPDVVINSGPLPPTDRLPGSLHDTPDGKYNYNSTLLGDLQPYAYGEGAYLSTQQSYLNIPHRIQKIIPVIYLPEPNGHNLFKLSHSVDDGDVGFTLRLNKNSIFCTGSKSKSNRLSQLTSVDVFVNLPTVNYILAGLQLHARKKNNLWNDLLRAFIPSYETNAVDCLLIQILLYICIKPFGIVRGSEKQGGQNEEGNSPATWPVPFVSTLVIDGREDHVVNMWHAYDVEAGQDLVLRLAPKKLRRFTLNHYYKHYIQKQFTEIDNIDNAIIWQLIPDVMSYDYSPFGPQAGHTTYYNEEQRIVIDQFSWQQVGFWHIGRSQMRMNKYCTDNTEYYHNDMVNALRSQYMLMTFQPTWVEFDTSNNEIVRILSPTSDTSSEYNLEKTLGVTFLQNIVASVEPKHAYWEIIDESTMEQAEAAPEKNKLKQSQSKRQKTQVAVTILPDGSKHVDKATSL